MSSAAHTGTSRSLVTSTSGGKCVETTVTTNSFGPTVSTSVENSGGSLDQGEDQEEEAELKYGASHVIDLFVPVSLCMVMVVFTMNTVTFYSQNDGRHLRYTPCVKETDSTSVKVLMSLGNALIMLCVVVIMTVLLIFSYKYRF
ncbi:Presenilin sel-12 [Parelaphostrongylus tenuis]|uniref:Presenilin sel-12 n=1 Tax=Parelaphostrongylus tenuis TaxID=148309 RepID=A0AAD5MBW1_PARTN|nr:Presenilin sel-12 [Parelaphostrongylus tenuis]